MCGSVEWLHANVSMPSQTEKSPGQEPKVKNQRKQESLFLRHVGRTVIASSASPEMARWQLDWSLVRILIGWNAASNFRPADLYYKITIRVSFNLMDYLPHTEYSSSVYYSLIPMSRITTEPGHNNASHHNKSPQSPCFPPNQIVLISTYSTPYSMETTHTLCC